MKRVWIGLALIVFGIVTALLPVHILMTGLCLAGYGLLCLADWLCDRRGWKKGWHTAIRAAGTAVFVLLAVGMAIVGWNGREQDKLAGDAQYAVVLGAQIHGTQPSRTLRERLDAAYEFQRENPDVVLIVSGGQGSDESATEASVMYGYLQKRGADMSRVFREERASDTRENLLNSAVIAADLGLDAGHPVIVTSEFHMCRAKYIAGTLGLKATGVPSRTRPWILMLNYELREVFAFGKAWAVAAVS